MTGPQFLQCSCTPSPLFLCFRSVLPCLAGFIAFIELHSCAARHLSAVVTRIPRHMVTCRRKIGTFSKAWILTRGLCRKLTDFSIQATWEDNKSSLDTSTRTHTNTHTQHTRHKPTTHATHSTCTTPQITTHTPHKHTHFPFMFPEHPPPQSVPGHWPVLRIMGTN